MGERQELTCGLLVADQEHEVEGMRRNETQTQGHTCL